MTGRKYAIYNISVMGDAVAARGASAPFAAVSPAAYAYTGRVWDSYALAISRPRCLTAYRSC